MTAPMDMAKICTCIRGNREGRKMQQRHGRYMVLSSSSLLLLWGGCLVLRKLLSDSVFWSSVFGRILPPILAAGVGSGLFALALFVTDKGFRGARQKLEAGSGFRGLSSRLNSFSLAVGLSLLCFWVGMYREFWFYVGVAIFGSGVFLRLEPELEKHRRVGGLGSRKRF
jgi:hypothetical protein